MGALLEFTKGVTSANIYLENPLNLSNSPSEYRIPEDQLPNFLKDLSEDLLLMICQRYRQKYGRELTHFEIKHQHLLDQISAQIASKLQKGLGGLMAGGG